jgi:hypothetical protein
MMIGQAKHFCFFLKREDSEVAAVGFIEWLGLGGKSDTDQASDKATLSDKARCHVVVLRPELGSSG